MVRINSRLRIITIVFLLTIFLFPAVSAPPKPYTLTATTGDVDLKGGVKVRITFVIPEATVSHSSTIRRGHKEIWGIKLSSGQIDIAVYVPAPVSQWHRTTKPIPIGLYSNIPIATGISARAKVEPTAFLDPIGEATLSTDTLLWSSEGRKRFSVISYSYAAGTIAVKFNFNFIIALGLVIEIPSFSFQTADTNIGAFPASPTFYKSMTVFVPSYVLILDYSFFGILLLLIVAFVILGLKR